MQQATLRIALDLVAGWLTFLMRGIQCPEGWMPSAARMGNACPDRCPGIPVMTRALRSIINAANASLHIGGRCAVRAAQMRSESNAPVKMAD